jgi:hypothetical protein
MIRHFQNQTFKSFYDRNSAALFCDLKFDRCRFESSAVSITLNPKLRSTVRNVCLTNCELRGCALDCAVIQDVVIDGLKTNGLFQTWGAVFCHVILKSKVEDVMTSGLVAPGRATTEQQRAFDIANEEFYSSVDWALDISQAEFGDCTLWGIPAKLVRRDPETQFVVTRAKAIKGEWRNLDLAGTHWPVSLGELLRYGLADTVLVAPKRSKKFKTLLRGLQLLREAGIAEPN